MAIKVKLRTELRALLKSMLPGYYLARIKSIRDSCWDIWYGVQTTDRVEQSVLKVLGSNASHASPYESTSPKLIERVLTQLKLDYRQYTFIDFGSGKGRVLLVAARFPFKAVLGVEFATELHNIATENLRRYRWAPVRCGKIECIHRDAVDLPLPLTPLVLFFFNPFSEVVMQSVMQNLMRSLHEKPRDVRIICVGSWTQTAPIERMPGTEVLLREAHAVTYRVRKPMSTDSRLNS